MKNMRRALCLALAAVMAFSTMTLACTVWGVAAPEICPEEEHRWVDRVVTLEPTCVSEGLVEWTCAVCGFTRTETIPVDPDAHSWDDGFVSEDPTCLSEGEMTYTCTICGATKTEPIPIDPDAHDWDGGEVIVAPTCVSEGEIWFTCTNCGSVDKEVLPIDHEAHAWDDGVVTAAPTCSANGEKIYTCTVCGATMTYPIPVDPSAHCWDDGIVWKNPTCSEEGELLYTCTVCGETMTDAIDVDPDAHEWDYNGVVTMNPTCSEEGELTYTCVVCGATITEPIPVDPDAHDWGYWEEENEDVHIRYCLNDPSHFETEAHDFVKNQDLSYPPTVSMEGQEVWECTVCVAQYVVALPRETCEHRWDEGVVTKGSTCTEEGELVYTCTLCADTRTEPIPVDPDAHCWGLWEFEDDNNHIRYCENDPSHYETEAHSFCKDEELSYPPTATTDGLEVFVCTICDGTTSNVIPHIACDHIWDDGVVTKEPTCVADGERVYTCSLCGSTYSDAIPVDPNAHCWGLWEFEDDNNHIHYCENDPSHFEMQAHSYCRNEELSYPPTVTETGLDVMECQACGGQKWITIPTLTCEHSWDDGVLTRMPTCVSYGEYTYTCTICDTTYIEPIDIDPQAHEWDSGIEATEPTCSAEGEFVYTCTLCGETRSEPIDINPNAHDWGEWVVTKEATMEETGEETRTCSLCGGTESRSTPKLPVLALSGGAARPGDTVEVTVSVQNNPGFVSMILRLSYDPQVLTLIDVRNGDVVDDEYFQMGGDLTELPFGVGWINALGDDCTDNGTLVTFTFTVSADATAGNTAVTLTYDAGSTFDMQLSLVTFNLENAVWQINTRVAGDSNGDGAIDLQDVAQLLRFIVGGWDATVIEENADVNMDGRVDLRDAVLLQRYLAGGWGVVL